MKNILFISIAVLFAISAQSQKKADMRYQLAVSEYEKKNYYQAGVEFQNIVENFKDFKYFGQCMYNTAYSYQQADSVELAITWYEKIRASDLKDDSRVGGRGIFEPYANFKHYSTYNIATIEYNRGNYEKALAYYKQALEKFPYQNDSETSLRINKNRLAIYLTDCSEKLEQYEDALLAILPQSLDSKGSSNYETLVNRSIQLINDYFDKDSIKSELESTLDTIEENKQNNSYSITFRKKEIQLFPYLPNIKSAEDLKKEILNSALWKKLNED